MNQAELKQKLFSIVGKLDNGSHSSSQLQWLDETLLDLIKSEKIAVLEELKKKWIYLGTFGYSKEGDAIACVKRSDIDTMIAQIKGGSDE